MVVDTSEFFTFSEWFGGALKQFVVATIVVLLIGLFISYLYSLFPSNVQIAVFSVLPSM